MKGPQSQNCNRCPCPISGKKICVSDFAKIVRKSLEKKLVPPWTVIRTGRGPSHQSHVLEHRDTYGQAQVCSKGHQGSSVDSPCQTVFFVG